MRTGVRLTLRVFACLVPLALAPACASGSRRLLLADGSYELKCDGALSSCLMQMEKTCAANGYEVVRATEQRGRIGPLELATEIVRSEAIVRCRKGTGLLASDAPAPSPVPAATDAPPPLPPHAPLPALSAAPAASAAPPSSSAPVPAPPASSPPPSPPPAAP